MRQLRVDVTLDAIIRNDIRKAVWRIINTDDEFTIVPAKLCQHPALE